PPVVSESVGRVVPEVSSAGEEGEVVASVGSSEPGGGESSEGEGEGVSGSVGPVGSVGGGDGGASVVRAGTPDVPGAAPEVSASATDRPAGSASAAASSEVPAARRARSRDTRVRELTAPITADPHRFRFSAIVLSSSSGTTAAYRRPGRGAGANRAGEHEG